MKNENVYVSKKVYLISTWFKEMVTSKFSYRHLILVQYERTTGIFEDHILITAMPENNWSEYKDIKSALEWLKKDGFVLIQPLV